MDIDNLANDEEFKAMAFTIIDLWGVNEQFEQLTEECAELIVAQRHLSRGRGNFAQLMEEVADVEIMIAQIRVLYQDDLSYNNIKQKKLDRLVGMVEGAMDMINELTQPQDSN